MDEKPQYSRSQRNPQCGKGKRRACHTAEHIPRNAEAPVKNNKNEEYIGNLLSEERVIKIKPIEHIASNQNTDQNKTDKEGQTQPGAHLHREYGQNDEKRNE
jgi:hypothetical protein